MSLIERFVQPSIVREAERILRDEAANIRHEEQIKKLGYEILFNCYGQVFISPVESLVEDEQ